MKKMNELVKNDFRKLKELLKNDNVLILDVTKIIEAKDQKKRDANIEELLYEIMQLGGHSLCYRDFLRRRDLATMAWFNKIKKGGKT